MSPRPGATGPGSFTFLGQPLNGGQRGAFSRPRERRAAGTRSPKKQQGWGWELSHLPGLLHLPSRCFKHLPPVGLWVRHTLVLPYMLRQGTPPAGPRCGLSQGNTGCALPGPIPVLSLARPHDGHR